MDKKVKVLIIDDSALIRMLLTKALSESDKILVIGTAEDPFVAREMIKKYKPDVLTLDIEMPKMDGLTFLKNLMRLRPMPVVMVSSLTKKGADETFKSLEYGALDFLAKPDTDIEKNLMAYSDILIEKVLAAASANTKLFASTVAATKAIENQPLRQSSRSDIDIISIGASTGGTEAIKSLVSRLSADFPPIVITQHIPPVFSTSFAKRLNDCSAITAIEVTEKIQLEKGHAYLAPGDKHLLVKNIAGKLYGVVDDTEAVNRHKPSVDVLFNSVGKACGKKSIAIILTGMGADGANEMKTLNDNGVHTIAQDEASSVVWGMPGVAVGLGAASDILSLQKIPERLESLVFG